MTSFIYRHPDIKRWLDNHPKLIQFFWVRFNTKCFFGFPFTLIILASVSCLWIFISIAQDYFAGDSLIAADIRIANLLFSLRSVSGVHILYGLTGLGSPITGLIVIGILTAVIAWYKQWKTALLGVFWFIGVEGTAFFLKFLFHRTRPDLLLRAIYEDSYSLPSGHATTAAFIFGYTGYLAFLRYKTKKARVTIFLLAIILIAVVDFSRMYLGVHYFSDVVAGNMVGFLGVFAVIVLDQWFLKSHSSKQFITPRIALIGAIVALLVTPIVLYNVNSSPWTTPSDPELQQIQTSDVQALFRSGTLPTHSETLIGEAQEPVSLILVVPDACLSTDFAQAGWTQAVELELSSIFKIAEAALFHDAYLAAPMTPSFYNTRVHDFGFERPTEVESVRQRHHARFWDTFYATPNGRLYVGTASLDTGIKWGITHSIAPDIDTERDEIVSDLVKAGVVEFYETIDNFVDPVLGQNFAEDFFFTNGGAVFMQLKDCEATPV